VAADLLQHLRAATPQCSVSTSAAEALPAGFGQVDDIILLLQPLPLPAAQKNPSALESTLRHLAEKNFLTGTQAISEAGLWVALVCGCASAGLGFHAELTENEGASIEEALLADRCNCALVTARPRAHVPLANFVERGGLFAAEAIGRVTPRDIRLKWMGETVLEASNLHSILDD